jgi:oligopeptidase A
VPQTDANPLLASDGLPKFDRISAEHVVPAVRDLLASAEVRLAEIEADAAPTWERAVAPLDELGRRFEHTWGPVTHLFGVKNSPELRTAYEEVLPDVVAFSLRARQSEPLYRALKGLKAGEDWPRLEEAQRRIVDRKLLTAELAGIGLSGEQRERFNEIAKELSKLGSDYSNHVLDATKVYALIITDAAEAEGLPESLKRLTAQSYNQHKGPTDLEATAEQGPWRITLDMPCFNPFMKHCRRRELREEVYRAYMTRASSGDLDNSSACRRILELRREQAQLLGYADYAQVSLAEKMAPGVDAVLEMLERLRTVAWDAANSDMEGVHQLAIAAGESRPIAHWDVAFWAERLREMKFKFSEEELRPYFPHERVLQGLLQLVQRLFGVSIVSATEEAPRWHPDVRYFKVLDDAGQEIAGFYYDPFSRPENKRPGAWMDDCLSRRRIDGRLQFPVAHLICNCTPPAGGKPSLMTFREVETLFHEFGHGLQHILTRVDYPDAAGISGIEWDAVELPSQFMENWCYHKPTVMGMTAHYDTGAPLPDELFNKICAARKFRAGSEMLRQITFGMTDLELHTRFDPAGTESIFDVQRRIMEKTSVLPMLPEDRFLCAFQHIFAGGYAAGYYSYKWAEVLSADAFGAFEEAGLDDEAAVRRVGRRFRDTVLALGGGRHPMDVFRDFRGRDPDPTALLRQYGLA